MKVICLANQLTKDQKKQLGISEKNDFQYPIEIGEFYTVLGISNDLSQNGCIILDIPYFYIFSVPLCLFDIIDDRPSKYWKIKKSSDHELTMIPEEFYQEYFYDDLSNGFPEIVEIYKQVVEKLEKEFDE